MTRLTVGALVLALVSTARAADPAADALVARGLDLRREGKSAEALEMFQRAHALEPTPRTLGQMGLVEASLEHWLDGEGHLSASLAAHDDPWVRKTSGLLEQALEITRSHIGELTVSGPGGAQISIGGKTIGSLPLAAPVRVAEGNLVVLAVASGFKSSIQTVPVTGGGHVSVALDLQPIETEPTTAIAKNLVVPPAAVSTPGTWRPWTAAALFVAGGAAVVWGAIWISVDGNDSCGSGVHNCRTVYNTRTPGWILVGSGAALAAAGGVVLITAHRGDSDFALMAAPQSLFLGGRF